MLRQFSKNPYQPSPATAPQRNHGVLSKQPRKRLTPRRAYADEAMRFPPTLGASLTFNVVQTPQAFAQGGMALRIPAWWHAPAEGITGGDEHTLLHAPTSQQRIQTRCALTYARRMRPRRIAGSAIGPKKMPRVLHRNCSNMPLR
jgi:hypothetical protein